jgi:hypothetical protein
VATVIRNYWQEHQAKRFAKILKEHQDILLTQLYHMVPNEYDPQLLEPWSRVSAVRTFHTLAHTTKVPTPSGPTTIAQLLKAVHLGRLMRSIVSKPNHEISRALSKQLLLIDPLLPRYFEETHDTLWHRLIYKQLNSKQCPIQEVITQWRLAQQPIAHLPIVYVTLASHLMKPKPRAITQRRMNHRPTQSFHALVAQEGDQPSDDIPAGIMAEDASEEEEAEEEESIDPELLFKATVQVRNFYRCTRDSPIPTAYSKSPQAIYQRYRSLNPDNLQFITDQYDTINEEQRQTEQRATF